MEEFAHISAEYVALGVNILAIAAIAIGSVLAAFGLFRHLLTGATEQQLRPIWLGFGRWLIAGLTFQLASDIVETMIAPTWEEIGKLAAIAMIRTFLSYFLDRDMETVRARGQERKTAE